MTIKHYDFYTNSAKLLSIETTPTRGRGDASAVQVQANTFVRSNSTRYGITGSHHRPSCWIQDVFIGSLEQLLLLHHHKMYMRASSRDHARTTRAEDELRSYRYVINQENTTVVVYPFIIPTVTTVYVVVPS